MRKLSLALLLACSTAFAQGSFGVVPNVGKLITSDAGGSFQSDGLTGTVLIRGSGTASLTAYLNLTGGQAGGTGTNNFTALETPDVVSVTGSFLVAYNSITAANFPKMTSGAIDLKYNPLESLSFPKLMTITCKHMYFSHNNTLTSVPPEAFPALTTMTGALVFSGNSALTSVAFPSLTTINHQLELDVTALTSLSLPSVTSIGGESGCAASPTDKGAILLGGIGNGFTSITLAGLTTLNGIIVANSNGITSVSLPVLATLGTDAGINLAHNKLSVSAVNALLVQLDSVKGSSTCTVGTYTPCIDLRYQTPSAAPTGAGLAAKNSLNAAGFTTQTD